VSDSMNHGYPPPGPGGHGLPTELHHHHQMPLPQASYTSSGHPAAPLPSLQGQPGTGYGDPYGQVAQGVETPTAPSSATTARDPEVEERSRHNLIPYSSVENGRRYA
jgi:hypothetical protein